MNDSLTHIDLFTGIGGFSIAAQWAGFKTVAFVEIEPYAQEIIRQRFGAVPFAHAERRNGRQNDERQTQTERGRTEKTCLVADAIESGCERKRISTIRNGTSIETEFCCPRIYGDIRTFDGTAYRGATLLTGGFPCQPFSQAGKRRGAADDRALWPEMFRVIREARPAWVVGENVAGIVTMELDNVLSDLEREGYAVQSLIIPACAVDARHRRDRVWIVGHAGESSEDVADAEGVGRQQATQRREPGQSVSELANQAISDTDGESSGRFTDPRQEHREWVAEPDVGRVANGIPSRVDRLKGLGNAIVPQVAYEILRVIAEIENDPHSL